MTLTISLPYEVLLELPGVSSITAETSQGFFGLLPRRLDCVAILVPGIFTYRKDSVDTYLAVDEGVLVKAGSAVTVSVHDAIVGLSLQELRSQVDAHFQHLDEEAQAARTAFAKIEVGFMRRLEAFHRGR